MKEILLAVTALDIEKLNKGEIKFLMRGGMPSELPVKCRIFIPHDTDTLPRWIPSVFTSVVGECICDKVQGFISENVTLASENVRKSISDNSLLKCGRIRGPRFIWHIRDFKLYDTELKTSDFRYVDTPSMYIKDVGCVPQHWKFVKYIGQPLK